MFSQQISPFTLSRFNVFQINPFVKTPVLELKITQICQVAAQLDHIGCKQIT